jgi:hypothetical protein
MHLEQALGEVNTALAPEQPLTVTIGDEFQGLFLTVEAAIEATMQLRVGLAGRLEFRAGIGWGELAFVDPERVPLGQDGPCWWMAREALELVVRNESSNRSPSSLRTACRFDEGDDRAHNALLVLRDHILATIDETDLVVLQSLLGGDTQKAAAEVLEVNQSSVSRRMQTHGLAALLRVREILSKRASF